LFYKVKFCNPDIGTNCWREICLLLFCTEATIYGEIMQSMKNETKIIRHTNLASAARRQIIVGGAPMIINQAASPTNWRRRRRGAAGAGL